eukprot:3495-Heterococcus_DN1.PRE.3
MLASASFRARRAISHFAPEVKFVDAQYTKPFMGKAEVEAYLRECAESLPERIPSLSQSVQTLRNVALQHSFRLIAAAAVTSRLGVYY